MVEPHVLNDKAFMRWRIPRDILQCNQGKLDSTQKCKGAPAKQTKRPQKEVTPAPHRSKDSKKSPADIQTCKSKGLQPTKTMEKSKAAGQKPAKLTHFDKQVEKKKDKEPLLSESIRKTLQPEAQVQLMKWMENASPNDRDSALCFLHSLAGQPLTSSERSQKDHLNQLLKSFERSNHDEDNHEWLYDHHEFSQGDGSSKLQHVRLLTPRTRKNRWMHTTWHHLPPYGDKEDPYVCKSSFFVQPHRQVPATYDVSPEM